MDKMTLEELLNKLIEKGWKPRNIECTGVKSTDYCLEFYTKTIGWISKDERHLVSKESGLWQYVCENGIVGRGDRITKRKKVKDTDSRSGDEVIYYSVIGSYNETDYQYRLIESALKDESELEQFLLDNIKIDD